MVVSASVASFGVSASISIPVVRFAELGLSLLPYPGFAGSSGRTLTVLRLVACSGHYQNAQARVQATLTDSSRVDVTSFSAVQVLSSNTSAAAVDILSRSGVVAVVRPSRAGTAELQATFRVQSSSVFSLTVTDSTVNVW